MEIVDTKNVVSEADIYKKALTMICFSWLQCIGSPPETVEEMTNYYLNKAKIELERVKT